MDSNESLKILKKITNIKYNLFYLINDTKSPFYEYQMKHLDYLDSSVEYADDKNIKKIIDIPYYKYLIGKLEYDDEIKYIFLNAELKQMNYIIGKKSKEYKILLREEKLKRILK